MTDPCHRGPPRRLFDTVIILLFLGVIAAPVTVMWWSPEPEPATLSSEYRRRVPYPRFALDYPTAAGFPDGFNAFLDDHFGLRDPLIRWHNRFLVFGLRESPLSKVVVGDHPWLYFNGDPQTQDASPVEDYLGIAPLSPAKLEFLRWMFHDQHAWLQEHGKLYLLVLIPSKPGVYAEHLPSRLTPTGMPSWREQLRRTLTARTDVRVLDATPALLEARRRRRVFDPTDTHWNEYGGFIAAQAILTRLHDRFPALEVPEESGYRIVARPEPGGDLARMIGLEREFAVDRIYLEPVRPPPAEPTTHGGGEFAPVSGGTGDPRLPRAIVYRDSYADRLIPFLTPHFQSIEYYWGQTGTKMHGIESRDVEIVLQIMADRVLNMNVFYAPRIQQEMNRRRFEQAETTLAAYQPDNAFRGLHAAPPLNAFPGHGGLVLQGPGPLDRLEIPPVPETGRYLPILRLSIRPSSPAVLRLMDPTGLDSAGRPQPRALARHRIEPGVNTFHIALYDPESPGPLTLELEGEADYVLYALAIRGHPR